MLPKRSSHAVLAILSAVLLFSNHVVCWAQLLQPMSPESCCTKDACKRMPGQPSHSSCRITPASTDRLAPPDVVSVPVPELMPLIVKAATVATCFRPAFAPLAPEYSPPPLFLTHSAFLI